jgi:hypothetical protein
VSPVISWVKCATDTATRDIEVEVVLEAIRTGGKKELKGQITQIRNRFEAELDITGDCKKAKLAVDPLKKQLPAVTWSGRFSHRASECLVQHSGLLCGDCDNLGDKLPEIRKKLEADPHVYAVFLSPTGNGLKVVVRVPADASQHEASFRAVQQYVRELCGVEIDQACKDPARLCFLPYDPEIKVNENAVELPPLPEPEKPTRNPSNGVIDLSERQRIAEEILGRIEWISETEGYCDCPNKAAHTTGDGRRDCKVWVGDTPNIYCFHNSCRGVIDGLNHALRSRIGKAEYTKSETPGVETSETTILGPPPPPYIPPPLALLPRVLQDYVHAAAESLNVDHSYVLLPLLSSAGICIGNSRSILLKRRFLVPPNIWTAVVGPVGSAKSPAIQEACFAVTEHERELDRQNRETKEIYAEDLAQWEAAQKKHRGKKPQPPVIQTCKMDDLTIESLADRLATNPRGVLIAKDEISHWFESFDLYRKSGGADISRWCSLHTGIELALDRRSDNRHLRIWLPRVCITGGIQPEVFRRKMSEDFFDRGLVARFLFAYPPARLRRWNEATVPDDLLQAVRELFESLWLLQPGKDDHEQPAPVPLRLSGEAKEIFVQFFNECGGRLFESGERETAAWNKLIVYAVALALVGQLLRDPASTKVSGDVMRAACELTRWFGNEAVRIYATLVETKEQREQRKLIEFILLRAGEVTVRDVMQCYWPLRGQREKAEQALDALVKAGHGKWIESRPEGPGRPTRIFQLLHTSTSTQFRTLRGESENSVDVDAGSSQKITPAEQPKIEPVSAKESASPRADVTAEVETFVPEQTATGKLRL